MIRKLGSAAIACIREKPIPKQDDGGIWERFRRAPLRKNTRGRCNSSSDAAKAALAVGIRRRMHLIRSVTLATVAACALACPGAALAEVVPVRYPEGFSHGFLALKNPAGVTVASGDFFSTTRGNRVTTHLVYRFKDGSIDDELTVFSQHGHFQLISDHHVQKGPAFEQPIDTTIVVATGKVTVRYQDDHGAEKTEVEQLELPPTSPTAC